MYYYTLASLPMQLYGQHAIKLEDVKAICRDSLSDKDYARLMEYKLDISNEIPHGSDAGAAYYAWERSLRNALVQLRAAKLRKDPRSFLQAEQHDLAAELIADEAVKRDNPLEAEEILNRGRWNQLESLVLSHHYDFDHLAIYYLQAQLNERMSHFKEEEGFSKYKEIYQHILENFNQSLESGEIE